MKVCHTCNRQYADSLKFCLEDGTVLTTVPDAGATLIDPPATLRMTPRQTDAGALAPRRNTTLLFVAVGAIALVLVIGVVAVLIMFSLNSQTASPAPSSARSTPSPNLPPPLNSTTISKEVEGVNNEVGSALVNGDPDALTRLLADDYRYVSDVGLTLNKLEVLMLIRTGNLRYEYLNTSNPKVEVNAEMTKADVTAQARSKGQLRRQPFTDSNFYRNSFEKRDGRWQLVSATVWHRQ